MKCAKCKKILQSGEKIVIGDSKIIDTFKITLSTEKKVLCKWCYLIKEGEAPAFIVDQRTPSLFGVIFE